MKTLIITFHAKAYKKVDLENSFKIDVCDEAARILTANPYELNATEQANYSELIHRLKNIACDIAILQTNETFIYTEVVDIR